VEPYSGNSGMYIYTGVTGVPGETGAMLDPKTHMSDPPKARNA